MIVSNVKRDHTVSFLVVCTSINYALYVFINALFLLQKGGVKGGVKA